MSVPVSIVAHHAATSAPISTLRLTPPPRRSVPDSPLRLFPWQIWHETRAQPLPRAAPNQKRSEEHTSELQSRLHLVCRLLLEKKKKKIRHKSMRGNQ